MASRFLIMLLNQGPLFKWLIPKILTSLLSMARLGEFFSPPLQKNFVPRFPERDEGERELPFETYPWDGVSGVRTFSEFAATTVVGVY